MNNSTLAYKSVDDLVVPRPLAGLTPRVSPDDLAILTVVDFDEYPAFTVDAQRCLSEAMQDMLNLGVRSLLVVNRQRELLGLVTAYDITGERPILYLQSPQCTQESCSYEDITVGDIMTSAHELTFLDFEELLHTKVRDLVTLFRELAASHFLVVRRDGTERVVAGIVSAAEVARQLGMDVEVGCTALGLAKLHRALRTDGLRPSRGR